MNLINRIFLYLSVFISSGLISALVLVLESSLSGPYPLTSLFEIILVPFIVVPLIVGFCLYLAVKSIKAFQGITKMELIVMALTGSTVIVPSLLFKPGTIL